VNGRPTDRPAGLTQTLAVGRSLMIGDRQVWVTGVRPGVADLSDGHDTAGIHEGDVLDLDDSTRIWVVWAKGKYVRLAIDAPRDIIITRTEPTPDIP
jgi:hypothetical protein